MFSFILVEDLKHEFHFKEEGSKILYLIEIIKYFPKSRDTVRVKIDL